MSQDQNRKAIKIGAISAGWRVDEVSDTQMLATSLVRGHTVVVSIDYSADDYSLQYMSSVYMKVRCGEVYDSAETAKVTKGGSPCPGGAPPTFIHPKYQEWVDELNRGIQAALQAYSS